MQQAGGAPSGAGGRPGGYEGDKGDSARMPEASSVKLVELFMYWHSNAEAIIQKDPQVGAVQLSNQQFRQIVLAGGSQQYPSPACECFGHAEVIPVLLPFTHHHNPASHART